MLLAKKSDSVGRRKMPTSKLLCAVALLQAALALPLAQLKAKPPKEPPKIAVTSASEFRTLMDGGATAYADLDVRGDSSSLPADHPVIAALHERLRSGSSPGARDDGMRIALAIEGGGMRGSVAAGMVAALHHLNLTDAFDGVYGSSAGTLIGAYFLSRQLPLYGCSIYYEQFPSAGREFLDLRNIARTLGFGGLRLSVTGINDLLQRRLGMPVLNLDYVHDEVVQKRMPIDWARLWEAQEHQPLRVVASNLAAERAVVLGARSHWASLPELCYCMRASMLLPGLCGPVVPLPLDARAGFGPDAAKAAAEKAAEAASKATDEEHAAAAWRDAMAAAKPSGAAGPLGAPPEPYADAMLYEPIPYRAALAEGATHVLVLRTRPDGVNVVKKQSAFEKLVGHRFFKRKMRLPHVADHMMEQKHRQIYAEDILTLNEGLSTPPPAEGAPQLLPIALQPGERGPEVSNLQTACAPLYHAVRCGFARAYDVLAPAGAPDGWDVATEIFDDEILKEIEKKQKAPI